MLIFRLIQWRAHGRNDAILPSMAAMDLWWNGLPRSLRWPCASSSAEMATSVSRLPPGRLRASLGEQIY